MHGPDLRGGSNCARGHCKKKVIARRSGQKSQWLDVLVAWITRAGLEAEDQVFTRNSTKHAGGRVGRKGYPLQWSERRSKTLPYRPSSRLVGCHRTRCGREG